jgi:hypothetical protein
LKYFVNFGFLIHSSTSIYSVLWPMHTTFIPVVFRFSSDSIVYCFCYSLLFCISSIQAVTILLTFWCVRAYVCVCVFSTGQPVTGTLSRFAIFVGFLCRQYVQFCFIALSTSFSHFISGGSWRHLPPREHSIICLSHNFHFVGLK